ncbi:MAG: hypothetical protein GXN93_01090 [Candidatus Diapherotrites archaeon]|nr:hypothetical protein [Candidatus Diapherotrites archaeon]
MARGQLGPYPHRQQRWVITMYALSTGVSLSDCEFLHDKHDDWNESWHHDWNKSV